jgi:hypothetical protein
VTLFSVFFQKFRGGHAFQRVKGGVERVFGVEAAAQGRLENVRVLMLKKHFFCRVNPVPVYK